MAPTTRGWIPPKTGISNTNNPQQLRFPPAPLIVAQLQYTAVYSTHQTNHKKIKHFLEGHQRARVVARRIFDDVILLEPSTPSTHQTTSTAAATTVNRRAGDVDWRSNKCMHTAGHQPLLWCYKWPRVTTTTYVPWTIMCWSIFTSALPWRGNGMHLQWPRIWFPFWLLLSGCTALPIKTTI